jgi:hypothetical protein
MQALLPRQFDDEEIALIRTHHRRMLDSVVLRGVPKFRLSNFAQPTLQCAQLEDSKAIATDSDGSIQVPPEISISALHYNTLRKAKQPILQSDFERIGHAFTVASTFRQTNKRRHQL